MLHLHDASLGVCFTGADSIRAGVVSNAWDSSAVVCSSGGRDQALHVTTGRWVFIPSDCFKDVFWGTLSVPWGVASW